MINNNKTLMLIFSIFIAIIIGMALIIPIAQNTKSMTNSYTVTNETISGVNMGVAETLANDDLVSFTTLWNTTGGAIPATNYTVVLSTGVLTVNTNDVLVNGSDLKATYVHYDDNHVTNSAATTIVDLVILFFALGVALLVMGGAYKGLKDNGII